VLWLRIDLRFRALLQKRSDRTLDESLLSAVANLKKSIKVELKRTVPVEMSRVWLLIQQLKYLSFSDQCFDPLHPIDRTKNRFDLNLVNRLIQLGVFFSHEFLYRQNV